MMVLQAAVQAVVILLIVARAVEVQVTEPPAAATLMAAAQESNPEAAVQESILMAAALVAVLTVAARPVAVLTEAPAVVQAVTGLVMAARTARAVAGMAVVLHMLLIAASQPEAGPEEVPLMPLIPPLIGMTRPMVVPAMALLLSLTATLPEGLTSPAFGLLR